MIDSHCHLADEAFGKDLEPVVARARAAGVSGALCILDATLAREATRADEVQEAWPAVRFATGVHPHHAGAFTDRPADVGVFLEAAVEARPGTVAVGEIGLDYHYDFAPRDVQREVFRRQIAVARDRNLPIVIHTRDAEDETFELLEEPAARGVSGVFHCFTGGPEMARRALGLGFHVSFSGIATFRSADEIRAAAKLVSDDRLLVETDAPYLAPVPYRGQRNEPAWVATVVERLAELRETNPLALGERTLATFEALFGTAGSG